VFVDKLSVAVQFPPSLIRGPQATTEYITENEGDKVTLVCTVTGSPVLEYVVIKFSLSDICKPLDMYTQVG